MWSKGMFDFRAMRRKRRIDCFDGIELKSILESDEHGLFLCYWMDSALPEWKTISDYKDLSIEEFNAQCSNGGDVYLYVPITKEVYDAMEAGEIDIRTGMLSYNGGEGYYQIDDGEIEVANILEKTLSSVPDAGVYLND